MDRYVPKPSSWPAIRRILIRAGILEICILVAMVYTGYRMEWTSIRSYGDFSFMVGMGITLTAGFTIGGLRQMGWAFPAFINQQKIVTEMDLEDGKKDLGILYSFSTPIFLGLAGITTILLGVLLESIPV